MENKMNFKKLEFEQNSGDWFADTYHNVLMIFKREVKNITDEYFKDVFILSCFDSVYEFDTFEECEIKANEENQKHLQKNIDEILQYIQLPISRINWEKVKDLKYEDLENFGKKFELKVVEK